MISKEALERMKADLIKIQCELFDDNCNDERVLAVYQLEDYQTIKQDLERLQQLEIADRNNQNLVKTNVDLINKNLELQKDNNSLQGLLDTTKEDYINIRLENEELLKEIQNLKEDLNLTTIERTNLEDKWHKEHLKCCELEKENNELKDQVAYLKEDGEEWQSAYEWSQAQNSILKLKNKELKEIIKANFFYHKNSEEIGYRKPMPKYQDKIKEVLEND